MATKKSGGSTTLGRDSAAQRLGVKLFGSEAAKPGAIIIRQRGTKYHPGKNVRIGKDDTLYSTVIGKVKFSTKKIIGYNNKLRKISIVEVVTE